jgi:hypothetical protein
MVENSLPMENHICIRALKDRIVSVELAQLQKKEGKL